MHHPTINHTDAQAAVAADLCTAVSGSMLNHYQAPPHVCEEQVLLDVTDAQVEHWLEAAKAGSRPDLEWLCSWAYLTAFNYYRLKTKIEQALSLHDAEELAGQFFLDFEQAWPELRSATRFTRRVLQSNLRRFLQRKRQQRRYEVAMFGGVAADEAERPWERWSDEQWYQYQAALCVLNEADEQTRALITYKLKTPPLACKEMAEAMNMTETAVRMRISRFYAAVRRRYHQIVLKNRT